MAKPCAVLVIWWGQRVLILLRAEGSPSPNTFCFPGGHSDNGELSKNTAFRETLEETGLLTFPDRYKHLGTALLKHADIDVFQYKLPEEAHDFVRLSYEHSGYLWVDPQDAWVHELPLTGRVIRTVLASLRDGTTPSFA